jgi:KTSC domain
MDREIVVSVSVRAVGYDRETSTLEIEFCDSSVYQYSNVPEDVYRGLMSSLGFNFEKTDLTFFNEHIKGNYKQKTIRRPRLSLFKGILET